MRSTITSQSTRHDRQAANEIPRQKRLGIIAAVILALSLGFVAYHFITSEPEYIEVVGTPDPDTTQITITNTTFTPASVKITAASETTPPTGFVNPEDMTPLSTPMPMMSVELDEQQGSLFMLADTALPPGSAPAELEIEVNVGGTPLKSTFLLTRKKRLYLNIYDATGSLTFDTGPGVTAK